ncbi:S1 family peptidase [Vibrio sp. SCSIO 43137]|uniref:S1 family peptidase n=1 Tax=Vibrio sp. SCSIO 43137 TaxID=3021011 RepID=UPI002307AF6F|nr:serine protease [Vibrio sp. SCSIO 43137]WCE31703.1 serine protease [Vibrio sp. SCSIO 43137]
MKLIPVITALLGCVALSANAADKAPFIVNGSNASVSGVGGFPSYAAIYTFADFDSGVYSYGQRCGSTIIDEWHVLTAAHCVSNQDVAEAAKEFTVIVPKLEDETNFNEVAEFNAANAKFWVEKIYVHSGYNKSSLINDIAILKLESAMTLVAGDKINLPVSEASYNTITSAAFKAVGLGYTSPGTSGSTHLLQTDLKIYPNQSNCGYGANPSTQLCMYSDNIVGNLENAICSGDSGGPLYWNDGATQRQIGISSYGPAVGCGNATVNAATSVFTEVNDYKTWINNIVSNTINDAVVYTTSNVKRDAYRADKSSFDSNIAAFKAANNVTPSSGGSSAGGGSVPLWSSLLLLSAALLRRRK